MRVYAQGGGEPPASVRMRIGPLYVNPTLALQNAGRDTNVFNDSKNPQEDFTVTISPATDLWLRLGPSWVTSNIREDIVWFQKFASERSANNAYTVKWIVPLNRLTVSPSWQYVNTRERPGFEIDARAERTETAYAMNLEYRFLSKTFISADGKRAETQFADGTTFLGVDLHNELSRTSMQGTVNLRHQVTPLTSLNFSAGVTQDRFKFDALRDTDSRTYVGSIKFDPAALIKGGATFGYRDFQPVSKDVPGYKGSMMAVDLSYVLLGLTKLAVNATRDVQYSYDINQPYFLQTGVGGSIAQQIFGPLDVVVRGGLRRLEYQTRTGVAVAFPNRTDHSIEYGGGIGYHFGQATRVGVNLDHSQRDSLVDTREFQGWTYGLSVTVGSGS
jgi:hypothetical protein